MSLAIALSQIDTSAGGASGANGHNGSQDREHDGVHTVAQDVTNIDSMDVDCTFNLVAHSRGAISAVLIANRIASYWSDACFQGRKTATCRINILAIDPVDMSRSSSRLEMATCAYLGAYQVVTMLHDSSPFFKLCTPWLADPTKIGHVKNLPMPGTHGSATFSAGTSKIGMASRLMVLHYLHKWSQGTGWQAVPPTDVAKAFAEVYEELTRNARRGKDFVPDMSGENETREKSRFLPLNHGRTRVDRVAPWEQANYNTQRESYRAAKRAPGKVRTPHAHGTWPQVYYFNRFHELSVKRAGMRDFTQQCVASVQAGVRVNTGSDLERTVLDSVERWHAHYGVPAVVARPSAAVIAAM